MLKSQDTNDVTQDLNSETFRLHPQFFFNFPTMSMTQEQHETTKEPVQDKIKNHTDN